MEWVSEYPVIGLATLAGYYAKGTDSLVVPSLSFLEVDESLSAQVRILAAWENSTYAFQNVMHRHLAVLDLSQEIMPGSIAMIILFLLS